MSLMCSVCEKQYSHQRTLNFHLREKHQQTSQSIPYEYNKFTHKCLEGCYNSFINIKTLRDHLEQKHQIKFETETIHFDDIEDFTTWLANLNRECVQYVNSHYKNHRRGYKTTYYYCNRGGNYSSSVLPHNRKRKLKWQGSCKINTSCTSTIIVCTNLKTQKLTVTYQKKHYGHDKDLQHIRVAKELKNDLKSKRDIQSMKEQYTLHIDDMVLDETDSISVDLWAEEYKEHNFLYYKKQGVEHPILDVNDICLVFTNNSQEYLLKTFGNNIICIDSTFGLNKNNFHVTTVLIMDDYDEGVPVAFMLSNRSDITVIEFFFEFIKNRVGVLSPKVFMSDISTIYIDAWEKVMSSPMDKLYCSWRIDQVWKRNLNKITNLEKRRNIYKTLQYLQYLKDETMFLCDLNLTIEQMLEDEETAIFAQYFQNHYAENYEKWAFCFREKINLNIHVESMHEITKYYCKKAKQIKRLDKAIYIILSYIRNKTITKMLDCKKGLTLNHILEIDKRHEITLNSEFEVEISKNLWKVTSKDDNTHTVTKEIHSDVSCCKLTCKNCNICVHTYRCTCIDYYMRYTICKHIHCVVILISNNDTVEEVQTSPTLSEDSPEFLEHIETEVQTK